MSQTQENLLKAFAGESQARNKYTYFAEQARKEELMWIAEVFTETADNERAHAQEEYEQMKDGNKMTNTYDIRTQGTTLENLRNSVDGETHEYTEMYPGFAKIAEEEGDKEALRLFTEIGEVEEKHAERYQILADRLETGTLYKTTEEIEWKCLNCGYIHKGFSAPDECPVCTKPQTWYKGLGITR
jgi:rubrerythrin